MQELCHNDIKTVKDHLLLVLGVTCPSIYQQLLCHAAVRRTKVLGADMSGVPCTFNVAPRQLSPATRQSSNTLRTRQPK